MNPVDRRKTQAALRRAIIAVKSDYFAWPEHVQEHYRVALPDDDRFKIDKVLLATLFNIRADTPEAMAAAFDDFDETQYLLYNSAILPLTGIGDDCFYLTEWLGEHKTLLDFATLYDYDYADHDFQEQARAAEFPDYTAKPYRGSLYHTWARLLIDGAFYYANLSMVAGYIYSQLDDFGSDRIRELIPHVYVAGPNHGKREGNGRLWDRRADAGGQEAQLKELRQRYYRYTAARWEALSQRLDKQAEGKVYQVDQNQEHEPHMDFMFTDKTVLQAVRFRHFMSDCRAMMGDSQELQTLIDQERLAARVYLAHHYQDILENFDPTIVEFRKKRKIIVK